MKYYAAQLPRWSDLGSHDEDDDEGEWGSSMAFSNNIGRMNMFWSYCLLYENSFLFCHCESGLVLSCNNTAAAEL